MKWVPRGTLIAVLVVVAGTGPTACGTESEPVLPPHSSTENLTLDYERLAPDAGAFRELARGLLSLNGQLVNEDLEHWFSVKGQRQLTQMMERVHAVEGAMSLADISFDLSSSQERLAKAAIANARALDAVLSDLAMNQVPSKTRVRALGNTYKSLFAAYRSQ